MTQATVSRPSLLFAGSGILVVAALGLRLESHWQDRALAGQIRPARSAHRVEIPAPRDYVADPAVAAGEEQRGPRRIISLAPSVTETLCALGLADRLVGRTQFCTYPPSVASVPVIGGLTDANLEMIRALDPDLVVTTHNSTGVNRNLDTLGLRHTSLPHETLEDVFAAIERAGAICDRPETAHQLCMTIRADLVRVAGEARRLSLRRLRVLMVTDRLRVPPGAMWVAGTGSFLDDLLAMSGHDNAAGTLLQASHGEIPLERLVLLDPDVIVTFPRQLPGEEELLEAYRSWWKVGSLQAIREQRVRPVGGAEWLSAGPRIAVELHGFVTVLSEFQSETQRPGEARERG